MITRRMRLLAATASAAALLTACSSAAGGDVSYKLASFSGPNTVVSKVTEEWIKDIEEQTNGSVEIEQVLSEGMLPATESLAGVADRRAELGLIVPLYHPGELPLSQIISLPFRTSNMPAQMATFEELVAENEALREEWDQQNIHPFFWGISVPMVMGCTEPIESIDDFKGRTIRAASPMAEVLEDVGANVVAIPSPELRDSMERGVIDCWTSLPLDFLTDAGLHEVTDYIYDAGAGNYIAGIISMNRDVWNELTDDQRAAFEQASEDIQDGWTEQTAKTSKEACDKVYDAGNQMRLLPDQVLAELKNRAEEIGPEVFLSSAGDEGPAFLEEYNKILSGHEKEFADYESTLTECASRK